MCYLVGPACTVKNSHYFGKVAQDRKERKRKNWETKKRRREKSKKKKRQPVFCCFAVWVLADACVLPQFGLCVTTMSPSFAPSPSTPKLIYEYEVFVSFRGADNRTGFTSHLFAALDRKTIHAYKDDINLPRGEKIGPELSKAIETSRMAVVVFSKSYATLDRCLDELAKIMECYRVLNQRAPYFLPVR